MAKKQKLEASRLTEHIGYWMRLVSNNVSHSFARKLEASGVTVAEWVILREMYSGDDTTSPSAIAELTGLTRGAVSKLITRLLEKGLVSRKESSNDRRYQDIELTTKGASLVPKLAVLADQNDSEFFSCLNKTERSQLKALLQKLAEHFQIKTVPTE
ncbi:MAG: MarR family transcriptional regulator [Bdellovibrionota bacterium]